VNTEESNPHLTAKIVASYVRHHILMPDQLADLITSVHRAIGHVGQPPEPEEVLTPAVSVRRSVHRDHVICLNCGYRGKTLTRCGKPTARRGTGISTFASHGVNPAAAVFPQMALRPAFPRPGDFLGIHALTVRESMVRLRCRKRTRVTGRVVTIALSRLFMYFRIPHSVKN